MSFTTAGKEPVILSLPAWTPGAYEISYFARWVLALQRDRRRPAGGVGEDATTTRWRIAPAGATQLHGELRLPRRLARQRDVVGAPRFPDVQRDEPLPLSRGTEPELPRDRADRHRQRVARRDRDDARAATANTFTAANYHDLVDMPFFVGRVGLDSVRGRERLGAAGVVSGEQRAAARADARARRDREADPGGGAGLRRDAVEDLHGDAARRLLVRRARRPRAPELARGRDHAATPSATRSSRASTRTRSSTRGT